MRSAVSVLSPDGYGRSHDADRGNETDRSVGVCVRCMHGPHWHLYPPVNLWAECSLRCRAVHAVKVHDLVPDTHKRRGRKLLGHDVGQHGCAVDPRESDESVCYLLLQPSDADAVPPGLVVNHAGGCQAGQVAQPSHVREVTTPGTVVYRPEHCTN